MQLLARIFYKGELTQESHKAAGRVKSRYKYHLVKYCRNSSHKGLRLLHKMKLKVMQQAMGHYCTHQSCTFFYFLISILELNNPLIRRVE